MQFPARETVIKKTLLILFFMLLAALPRILSMRSTHLAPGGEICFADPDAYYYLRMAKERLGEEHALVMTDEGLKDMLRYVPDGMKDTIPLLSGFTAAVQRALEPLLHCSLEQTANRLTVLMPSLTVLPILLMLGVLLADLGMQDMYVPAAAAAAVISAMNSGFLRRSSSGRFDTDILIPFFVGMLAYLHYRIVRLSTARPAPGRLALYTVLLALTEGLFGRWWNAHLFFAGMIAGISILLAAIRFYRRRKRSTPAPLPDGAAGHSAESLYPYICLLLPLPALPAGLLAMGGLSGLLRSLKGAVDLFLFSSDDTVSMAEAWFPNALVSITEMQKPVLAESGIAGLIRTYSPLADNTGLIGGMGSITVCAAALLFWILWSVRILAVQYGTGIAGRTDPPAEPSGIPSCGTSGRTALRRADPSDSLPETDLFTPYIYITVWTLSALILSLQAVRFFMFCAMPVSLLAALFTAKAGKLLQNAAGRKSFRHSRLLSGALLWLMVLIMLFPTLYGAFRFSRRGSGTFVSDDLWAAAEYLRTRTAEDAIAASWWDYGYYFEYAGRRATLSDGGSQTNIRLYWLARAMADPDMELSRAILRMTCGSGDKATKWLLRKLGSGEEAAALLRRILVLDRDAAGRLLTDECGFAPEEAEELLLLSHPALSRDVFFVLSSQMADIAGWFPTFGYWKEDGAPGKKDFCPIASLADGSPLRNGTNEYLLETDEEEKETVSLTVNYDAQTGQITAVSDRIPVFRKIWYADMESGETKLISGRNGDNTGGMPAPEDGEEADLILLGTPEETCVYLLPAPLSDSLIGELYYRRGLWQDGFELLKAPGNPSRGETASVWKMR